MSKVPMRKTDLTQKFFNLLKNELIASPEEKTLPDGISQIVTQISKEKAWGPWMNASLLSTKGKHTIHFKSMKTNAQKTVFLCEYLHDGLLFLANCPRYKINSENIERYTYWLAKCILQERLLPQHKRAYNMPFDMRGLVDDVCYYEKKHAKSLISSGRKLPLPPPSVTLKDFSIYIQRLKKNIMPKRQKMGNHRVSILKNGNRIFPELKK